MRTLAFVTLALMGLAGLGFAIHGGSSIAQSPPETPQVVGEWIGLSETLVYGSAPHHPSDEPPGDKPRLREVDFTLIVEGQEGRRFWGRTKTEVTSEPFVALFSSSNVFGYGANSSGFYHFRSYPPDRLELCYTQPGTHPSGSIVAACAMFTRSEG